MQNIIEFGSGDNTTTSTSSQPELQHAPVNRVTMKPPPFYRTNPTVRFRRMESQFVSAGITNDTTNYHHILAAIPEDVAINLPMETEDYSSLKDSITQVYLSQAAACNHHDISRRTRHRTRNASYILLLKLKIDQSQCSIASIISQ